MTTLRPELLDGAAELRLREIEPFGGAAKVKLLRDGDEITDVAGFHRPIDAREAKKMRF